MECCADFIKVFPCEPIGGDRYIKALHVPATDSIGCGRWCEPTDRGQIHPVASNSDRDRHRIDSHGSDSTEAIKTHSGVGPSIRETSERCPRTNRGLAEEHCRQEIHSGGKVRAAIGTLTATRTAELRSIFTQQGDRSSNELCLP